MLDFKYILYYTYIFSSSFLLGSDCRVICSKVENLSNIKLSLECLYQHISSSHHTRIFNFIRYSCRVNNISCL